MGLEKSPDPFCASPVDPASQSLLVEFVETYLQLAGREQTEFQQIVVGDQEYAEVKQMITVYEQQGKQQGKQESLILLLEKKFGKLSAAMKRKVHKIDSTDRLESLLLAVLDAASLEEMRL